MKIRGGIRVGKLWESWPSAQLCIASDRILLRYRGEHALEKEEIEMLSFLRGAFTTEICIAHRCDFAESPIRFFPMFARDAYDFVRASGYPCERRKAPFYTKGDII